MRFYCINRCSTSSRTKYDVILFSGEFTKDSIKSYILEEGQISLTHYSSVTVEFYYYHSDQDKYVYTSSEMTLNTLTPSSLPDLVGPLSKVKELRLKDILDMLAGRGWMQKFYDPRGGRYYLKDNYPAQEKSLYKVDIIYAFEESSGVESKRKKTFHVLAESEAKARSGVLAQCPIYFSELQTEYGDIRANAFMDALKQWMSTGMPFSHVVRIDPTEYEEYFTGVTPEAILADIAPKAVVDSPSEAVNV